MGFFSSIGGIIGGAIGGPIGGAIGSALGGAVGGEGGAGGAGGGGPQQVHVISMPCPTVNNAGLIESWTWAKAGALLISANSTKAAYDAARDKYKIGKRYHALAKSEWEFFYDTYRPVERVEVAEINEEKMYANDYARSTKGHLASIDPVFANIDQHRLNLGSKFCVCPDAGIMTQFEIARATISGDTENFARKYAEFYADEHNDIRFARRVAAANRGRSLLSDSTGLASKASNFYGEYADGMSAVAQGAAQFAGFIDKRRPTEYPDRPNNRIDQYPRPMKQSPVPGNYDWNTEVDPLPVTPNVSPIGEGSFAQGGFGEPSIQQ